MAAPAVAGQDPFEAALREPFGRAHERPPVVPADVAERVDLPALRAPRDVVAREQERVAEQEAARAARVPGHRNDEEVGRERRRLGAGGLDLDIGRPARDVVGVEDALAAEALAEFRVIGAKPSNFATPRSFATLAGQCEWSRGW